MKTFHFDYQNSLDNVYVININCREARGKYYL